MHSKESNITSTVTYLILCIGQYKQIIYSKYFPRLIQILRLNKIKHENTLVDMYSQQSDVLSFYVLENQRCT